ncbi:hypothetical protein AN639_03155 [Candidatus Epulonipiscium fishelsonii]|uniref:Uncharacterized protein n=1 Tax=Candidatus Epulonipiscium fishelsonii TaxID=77094 RepID=A0ACC8XGN6_9FIRM|nr:hypothetical protein AN639_03155 [Epulopiscium sp. SCG-B05WGA-EpuloA1]ONI42614.1 hypothetical protein AN396_13610 [Epulopiscium sp. SCG-B11WGA-EpuloA1]
MITIDTRFTILGMTGAGKTCYLLGMYYELCAGLQGYTMITDEDKSIELRSQYLRILDKSLGINRFPAGTDSTTKYEFELQYCYDPIISFGYDDYAGGILTKKNSGDLEEYEEFKNSLTSSSVLFICIDGSLLEGNDNEEKIRKIKTNCSNVINEFISDYKKNNKKLPPISLVITKYDICEMTTSKEDLEIIIKEAFNPLFTPQDEGTCIVSIIPVSLGAGICDDDNKGELQPINIHVPIFFGIYFALYDKIEVGNEQIGKILSLIDAKMLEVSRLDLEIRGYERERLHALDGFMLWGRSRKILNIEYNRERKYNIRKELEINLKNLQEERDLRVSTLNTIEQNQKRLALELDSSNLLIYNNGNKISFADVIMRGGV